MGWESRNLAPYLEDLAARIDEDEEQRLHHSWELFLTEATSGCEVIKMPREHHTLPMALPLAGDSSPDPEAAVASVRAAIDRGVPGNRSGQGAKVLDCGALLRGGLLQYEPLNRWIVICHPDAQGPIDTAELVWGQRYSWRFTMSRNWLVSFSTS